MTLSPSYYPMALQTRFGGWDPMTGKQALDPLHDEPKNYFVLPRSYAFLGLAVRDCLVWRVVNVPGCETLQAWTKDGMNGGISLRVTPMKSEYFKRYYESLVEAQLDAFRWERRNRVLGERIKEPKIRYYESETIDRLIDGLDCWDQSQTQSVSLDLIAVETWQDLTGIGRQGCYDEEQAFLTEEELYFFNERDKHPCPRGIFTGKPPELKGIIQMGPMRTDVSLRSFEAHPKSKLQIWPDEAE